LESARLKSACLANYKVRRIRPQSRYRILNISFCHCEERSDVAIHLHEKYSWIATSRLVGTRDDGAEWKIHGKLTYADLPRDGEH
jgi:hypothetical protein